MVFSVKLFLGLFLVCVCFWLFAWWFCFVVFFLSPETPLRRSARRRGGERDSRKDNRAAPSSARRSPGLLRRCSRCRSGAGPRPAPASAPRPREGSPLPARVPWAAAAGSAGTGRAGGSPVASAAGGRPVQPCGAAARPGEMCRAPSALRAVPACRGRAVLPPCLPASLPAAPAALAEAAGPDSAGAPRPPRLLLCCRVLWLLPLMRTTLLIF